MSRSEPEPRDAYPHDIAHGARWTDNDVHGHVNNVVYYGLFDSAVNRSPIEAGVLDIRRGAVIRLVVETRCNDVDRATQRPHPLPDAFRHAQRPLQ